MQYSERHSYKLSPQFLYQDCEDTKNSQKNMKEKREQVRLIKSRQATPERMMMEKRFKEAGEKSPSY